MKIGINLLFLIPGGVGGCEIFARNLVKELAKIDRKNKYIIYGNNENKELWNGLPKNFKVVTCPFYARKRYIRIVWEQLILPFQCWFDGLDLLHSVEYTAPLFTPCPRVTTIYDLNYHFHPEDLSSWNLLVFQVMIPLVVRRTNKIIVHSKRVKQEFIDVFRINTSKIKVIYGGVADTFRNKIQQKLIQKTLRKYKIKGDYILSNAVSYPHKNLKSLVLAYANLIKTHKNINDNLVILGFPAKAQKELNRIINKVKIRNRVIFTGWVDPNDVPKFYKMAKMFVFPSLYEGFGLPLVESMATGTPLIASDASCVPEIVGDGGLIVDCLDIQTLSDSMYKILSNRRYATRLSKIGIKRSLKFSWVKFTKETLSYYRNQAQ